MATATITPTQPKSPVRDHYQAGLAGESPLARLQPFLDALPASEVGERQLGMLDHFHIRGPAATAELAAMAGVQPGITVLDAGSGLGGPSRFLARSFDCTVAGIDLSPAFVAVAEHLARREGLAAKVTYRVGDIADLPFDDASFDLVWTEHVLMNLADRDTAYREFARVLRPGGRIAFYEPIAIEGRDVLYPVPWAADVATSHLLTRDATLSALNRAGFNNVDWRDAVPAAMAAFASQSPAPAVAGLATIMGPRFPEMAANFVRNVAEGRIGLAMGVAARGDMQ